MITFLLVNQSGFIERIQTFGEQDEPDSKTAKRENQQSIEEAQTRNLNEPKEHFNGNEVPKKSGKKDVEGHFHIIECQVDEERRMRLEAEKKNCDLEGAFKIKDAQLKESQIECKKLEHQCERLGAQYEALQQEIIKITYDCQDKIQEMQRYHEEIIQALNNQLDEARYQVQKIKEEHKIEVQKVSNEWDMECHKLDLQVKELSDKIQNMAIQHEEEIIQVKKQVIEEEKKKHNRILKDLDSRTRMRNSFEGSSYRDYAGSPVGRKASRLQNSPETTSKQESNSISVLATTMNDQEVENLLLDTKNLRIQLKEASRMNGQLQKELDQKNTSCSQLEEEALVLHNNHSQIKELYIQEIKTLLSCHDEERRKWEQTEEQFKVQINNLKKEVDQVYHEAKKAKTDLKTLRQILHGNLNKVIDRAFIEHESQNSSLS